LHVERFDGRLHDGRTAVETEMRVWMIVEVWVRAGESTHEAHELERRRYIEALRRLMLQRDVTLPRMRDVSDVEERYGPVEERTRSKAELRFRFDHTSIVRSVADAGTVVTLTDIDVEKIT
jgi:hypothetical protein